MATTVMQRFVARDPLVVGDVCQSSASHREALLTAAYKHTTT